MEAHQKSNSSMVKESLLTTNCCWMLDVDGVITNPKEKKVTEKGLIKAISEKIDKGEIVALNTGRSVSWMINRVIKPIEKTVKNKERLENFLAVGEKGGSLLFFQKGKWITETDKNINVPEELKGEIRKLINDRFNDSMFFDETKLTMISTEMIDKYSISDYSNKQRALIENMMKILNKPEFKHLELTIDPTTIATDIQSEYVGKHFGARKIVNWFKEKRAFPKHIVAVGDSQSDTKMVEELQNEYPIDFIYVGDPEKLDANKLNKAPIFTVNRFEKGTLEFLQKTR